MTLRPPPPWYIDLDVYFMALTFLLLLLVTSKHAKICPREVDGTVQTGYMVTRWIYVQVKDMANSLVVPYGVPCGKSAGVSGLLLL